MANYATVKAQINANIKNNNNQEITGAILNGVLLQMVQTLADGGYLYKGVATPSTAPGTPDANVFYICPPGTYSNFGSAFTVPVGQLGLVAWNGSWAQASIPVGKDYDADLQERTVFQVISGYINTNNSTLPGSRTTSSGTWSCLVDCAPGDVFRLTGTGGNSKYYRMYAFYDANGAQIERYSGSGNFRTNPLEVTAPASAAKAVFNLASYDAATDKAERLGSVQDLSGYTALGQQVQSLKARSADVQTYGPTDLTAGAYVSYSNGAYRITNNSGWDYIVRPVWKGDKVTISTVGGSTARAYYFWDRFYNPAGSAAPSGTNTTLTPFVYTFEQDGYIAVNMDYRYIDQFWMTIERTLKVGIEHNADGLAALPVYPRYHNAPIPYGKGDLRVLSIGNSYLANSTQYLQELIDAAGLDNTKISHYILTSSASTLQYWAETSGTFTAVRRGGTRTMTNQGTLDAILAQDWDIITIQQYSGDAVDYDTYQPYLQQLIARIRSHCPNQKAAILFNQAWAYWSGYTDFLQGDDRWAAIVEAVTQAAGCDGVDLIPTGTAIQNARHTSLNSLHDLSADGTHLAAGVAKYVAACTWYQVLYSPVFNVAMLGNTATHTVTDSEAAEMTYEYADVTAANRDLCQQCAFYAVMDYKNIWPLE